MSRQITLANLRSLIQWQADIAGLTLRHTPASLTTVINQSIQRFREWVSDNGFSYYLVHTSGTLGTGATSPHSFYELDLSDIEPNVLRVYGLDLDIGGGSRRSLDAVDFGERNNFQEHGTPVAFSMYADTKVAILPAPTATHTYLLYYLPVVADLEDEDDTFDGKAGWEWWVVWDVFHALLHRDADPELLASVKLERDKIQEGILRRSRHLQRVGPMGKRDTRGETRAKRGLAPIFSAGIGGGASIAPRINAASVAQIYGQFFVDARHHGMLPTASAAANDAALQEAIEEAEDSGQHAVVMVPGGPGDVYNLGAEQIQFSTGTTLWFPGKATVKLAEAVPIKFAVGSIDDLDTSEGNLLQTNAAAGDMSITLVSGKGANFVAGGWYLMHCTTVIPGHHSAVLVTTAEYINVFEVTGDVLTLSRPLRYAYLTSATAQVYRPPWIEGFRIVGMRYDGNEQTNNAIVVCASWCMDAEFLDIEVKNAQQRGIRLQGTYGARVENYRQSNGLSSAFQGDSGHFSYCISEGGPCEGTIARGLRIDRCRHGYTTSGMVSNVGTSSPLNSPGFGVPTGTLIADGVHTNARGAGWDTHETGVDITFQNVRTLGSLQIGFQNRCVGTKLDGFYASDCIGAAIQNGADAQDFQLGKWDFDRCNLGTDDTTVDWTLMSVISDNSNRMYSEPARNLIDNGNFDIWERESTFNATGAVTNRWAMQIGTGAAATFTRQNTSFTPPTTPQSGRYFARLTRGTTGSTPTVLVRYDEIMRQTAGNRIWVSFDMRSDTGTLIDVYCTQYFGSGGSPSASVLTSAVSRTIDEAFRRYHVYFDMPTIEGKTIGDDDNAALITHFSLPTSEGNCFIDLKRVSISIGRVPGEYQLPIVAEEHDKCMRYYEKCMRENLYPGVATTSGSVRLFGTVADKNAFQANVHFTVRKAAVPTVVMRSTDTATADKVYNDVQDLDIDAEATRVGPGGFTGGILTSGDVAPDDVCSFLWEAYVPNFA